VEPPTDFRASFSGRAAGKTSQSAATRLTAFSAAVILAGCLIPPLAAAERVARVIDGDTILLEDGRKVRYAGINAPEEGEPYFRESTQANNLLVGGKEIRLEFGRSKKEKYGRVLAYVYAGKTFVQGDLIKQGWAIVTRTQSLPRYRGVLQ